MFFRAEDGVRDGQESRGLGDVYRRQDDSDNEATVLDMALDDSENFEVAGIDAAEVERVHNELLHIYALQAKANIPRTPTPTANASVCLLKTSAPADEDETVDLAALPSI